MLDEIMKTPDESRKDFEAWISAEPYTRDTTRIPADASWPEQYFDYPTQLAYEAWQQSALLAGKDVERLREMVAMAYSGIALYCDDGELQDNRVHPFIDFKRDSVEEIDRKMQLRAVNKLNAAMKATNQGET